MMIRGHFQKRQIAMEKTSVINILSSILAVGAIAAGASDAGSAILMGSQQISGSRMLAFSRAQESLADQTAIRLMKKNGFSLKGLINVFEEIKKGEKIRKINPYMLTHPLSTERIKNIQLNLEKQKIKKYKDLEKRFKLAKAKLNGFFMKSEQIKTLYNDNKLESLYAHALNNYKIGKINIAINLINRCINLDSENPYFYELKGQLHHERGDFYKAIDAYVKSSSILPDEKEFKLFLAKSLYHSGEIKNYEKSISLLLSYIKKDEFPIEAWHYLGLNYGKLRKLDYSSHAFAEKFVLAGKFDNAKIHIERAKKITKDPFLIKKLSDLDYEIKKNR